jgi:hypothetical protein
MCAVTMRIEQKVKSLREESPAYLYVVLFWGGGGSEDSTVPYKSALMITRSDQGDLHRLHH